MTQAATILDRVSDRGDAISIIDAKLAELFYAREIDSFIVLENVRAYLVAQSRQDLHAARF